MTVPSVQYGMVAGELSEQVFSRSDIDRYAFGLRQCRNWWIDYRGGANYRPGTEYINYLMNDTTDVRIVPFQYSLNDADSYLVVFGDLYIRFIQSGGFILESAKTITNITSADPAVVTSTSHSFSNGDWVEIAAVVGMAEVNNKLFEVANVATHTFELKAVPTILDVDATGYTAYTSGGTASRVYTLVSPYLAADLPLLHEDQDLNTLTLTRVGYAIRTLTRTDHTSWTLTTKTFGSEVTAPGALTLTPSGAGTAGMVFGVTAVDADGNESNLSPLGINELSVNYVATAGSMKVAWPSQGGVEYFNIYRSVVGPIGADMTLGEDLGFVGRAYGTVFNDPNILADYTITPPRHLDPFADGVVAYITVDAGGTGYAKSDGITATGGGGSGFAGYPIVSGGVIVAVAITDNGSGYASAPTIAFTTSTGSAATATATIGTATGNKPATAITFQQRRVYGGTLNRPRFIFGSRSGQPDNMDVSIEVTPADPYFHQLDSRRMSPIKHFTRNTRAMLAFTDTEIFEISGFDNQGITPLTANAEEQVFYGATDLRPVRIGNTVLYSSQQGHTIQGLKYNITLRAYQSEDLSILSNHLFSLKTRVVHWAYVGEPLKVVLGVTNDGSLLSFTYVDEENVKGWAKSTTKGRFKDIAVVKESGQDVAYVVVERFIQSRWTKMVERFRVNDLVEHAEDSWHVDSGLELPHTYPAAELVVATATGTGVAVTADASVFVVGDVGKIIRAGGGIMEVKSYVSPTQVTVDFRQNITEVLAEDTANTPLPVVSGDWTLNTPVLTVTGLEHLEGQTVWIVADGNVKPQKTVINGAVTWLGKATKVIVGLPYRGLLQTLPAVIDEAVIDHKRKRPMGVSLRVSRTRGLKLGANENELYSMKDRTTEDWGDPTRLRSDMTYHIVDGSFDADGSVVIVQDFPLPATVTGRVTHLEVGDEGI